jgi:hypothetical protein
MRVVPGFPIGRWLPEYEDGLLVCVTEAQDDPGDRSPGRRRDGACQAGASERRPLMLLPGTVDLRTRIARARGMDRERALWTR